MIKFILLYFYQGWNNVFYMLISADLFAAIVSIYKFFFSKTEEKPTTLIHFLVYMNKSRSFEHMVVLDKNFFLIRWPIRVKAGQRSAFI